MGSKNEDINEATNRVPARIYKPNERDVAKYFSTNAADDIDRLWHTNTTKIIKANNGKHYWVNYEYNKGNGYLKFKIAKPGKKQEHSQWNQ